MPPPRRVVLDTNVVVSALLSPYGPPGRLLDLVIAGDLHPLVDDRITAEYRDVARRPRFGFATAEVDRVLDALQTLGEHVTAGPLAVTLPDPDDVCFLEVAVAGRADALVTGNARHFVPTRGAHGVAIRSPREVLDAMRGEL